MPAACEERVHCLSLVYMICLWMAQSYGQHFIHPDFYSSRPTSVQYRVEIRDVSTSTNGRARYPLDSAEIRRDDVMRTSSHDSERSRLPRDFQSVAYAHADLCVIAGDSRPIFFKPCSPRGSYRRFVQALQSLFVLVTVLKPGGTFKPILISGFLLTLSQVAF